VYTTQEDTYNFWRSCRDTETVPEPEGLKKVSYQRKVNYRQSLSQKKGMVTEPEGLKIENSGER